MILTDERAVRAALAKYEPALFQAVHNGWRDWQGSSHNGRLIFTARSRACLVYDYIVQRAVAAFDGDPAVRIILQDETARFIFTDRVVLRFKKANGNGLGANIRTQATLGFVEQQQELPGLPHVQKVEVVYVLNALQTQVAEVLVTARDGDVRLWHYELAPDTTAEIIPLPTPAIPTAERGVRIKVRGTTDEQNSKTDNK